MTQKSFVKTPAAVLDYKIDWNSWLEADEIISTHTVTAETGLTKDSSSITDAGKSITIWISGGTLSERYEIICSVTTSKNRTDNRAIMIEIGNR